jgi:hypothetical protein
VCCWSRWPRFIACPTYARKYEPSVSSMITMPYHPAHRRSRGLPPTSINSCLSICDPLMRASSAFLVEVVRPARHLATAYWTSRFLYLSLCSRLMSIVETCEETPLSVRSCCFSSQILCNQMCRIIAYLDFWCIWMFSANR